MMMMTMIMMILVMMIMMMIMMMMMMIVMFESGNPPMPSMHVSSLTMPNFNPSKHKFKKIQCWPRAAH